jgi:hypothetical protein
LLAIFFWKTASMRGTLEVCWSQKSPKSSKISDNRQQWHIWFFYDSITCFEYTFGQINMLWRYFETFFVFLRNFLDSKTTILLRKCGPFESQNHRKCPKIIENHAFWTMCELLAYCEVVGMFLVHFWIHIGRFTVF